MANDMPADDVVGIDARLAAVRATETKVTTRPQPWEPGYGAEPTVVREESWLDKTQHKLKISGRAISGMWSDFWGWATGQAGDQGEALAKARIKKRPPSENTRVKQAVADVLATGQDPTAAAESQRIAQQADVAEGARQHGGDLGRATGVLAVAATRTVVETELAGQALRGGAAVVRGGGRALGGAVSDARTAKTAEEAIAEGRATETATSTRGIKPLDVAPYEQTTYRGMGAKGDQLTGDHIPSFAAVRANVEAQLGRQLTPAEAVALRHKTTTLVVPEGLHTAYSRTYAGRNTAAQVAADAKDLGAAARLDAERWARELANQGYDPAAVQRALEKVHQANREAGLY